MQSKGVIILGSSRGDGNTSAVARYYAEKAGYDLLDLGNLNIGHYDYNFKNIHDDFNPTFKKLVTNYDVMVFATPVYWYTMSGVLKVFFDRISDFLTNEKDWGRKLRGKTMAVLSCGSDDEPIEGFIIPFEKSADYLGMNFAGYQHTWLTRGEIDLKAKENMGLLQSQIELVKTES